MWWRVELEALRGTPKVNPCFYQFLIGNIMIGEGLVCPLGALIAIGLRSPGDRVVGLTGLVPPSFLFYRH